MGKPNRENRHQRPAGCKNAGMHRGRNHEARSKTVIPVAWTSMYKTLAKALGIVELPSTHYDLRFGNVSWLRRRT